MKAIVAFLFTFTLAVSASAQTPGGARVVCKGAEIPDGYAISGETTSPDCREGAWLLKRKVTPILTNEDVQGAPAALSPAAEAAVADPSEKREGAASREDSDRTGASWQRVMPAGQAFSIMMPGTPSAVDIPGMPNLRAYVFAEGNAVYMVTSLPKPAEMAGEKNPADGFAYGARLGMEQMMKKRDPAATVVFDHAVSSGSFSGNQYRLVSKQESGVYRLFWTPNRAYIILVIGADQNDRAAAKFLNSFRVLL